MSDPPTKPPFHARPSYRIVTAAFGLLLLCLGLYVLVVTPASELLRHAGGAGLVLLGGNAVHAALRSRESWLSRIGPLP